MNNNKLQYDRKLVRLYTASLLLSLSIILYWLYFPWPRAGYTLNPLRVIIKDTHYAPRGWVLFSFMVGLAAAIALTFTILLLRRIIKEKNGFKILIFCHAALLSLLILSLFIVEVTCSFFVPPRPIRAVRPQYSPDPQYNSWGFRDRERTVAKPSGRFRILFIGDSFLEVGWETPVSVRCEDKVRNSVECINLGVSGTGLKQYYYRYKEFGAGLSPDAVFLFFYTGNDFEPPRGGYSPAYLEVCRNFVAEKPVPSLLGLFAPRLTWLLVNRLRLCESLRGQKYVPNEREALDKIAQMNYADGVRALAGHMRENYFPDKSCDEVQEAIGNNGQKLWEVIGNHKEERLKGSSLHRILWSELNADKPGFKNLQSKPAAVARNDPRIQATMSWITAFQSDCEEKGIPFIVFFIPLGEQVDSEYNEFFNAWPNQYKLTGWVRGAYSTLSNSLKSKAILLVDLVETLEKHEGTYRKIDGHWNRKGRDLVAHRIVEEINRTIFR